MRAARILGPGFAAEIAEIDLERPLDAQGFGEIVKMMDAHAICVFRRETPLSDDAHVNFSRNFGPLEGMGPVTVTGRKLRLRPELVDVSNMGPDGKILPDDSRQRAYLKGNNLWHTDSSFMSPRARYSALNAILLPPEPYATEFADMRAAYDALPETMRKRIENLRAEHSIWHSRVAAGYPNPTEEEIRSRPPVQHALVNIHPTSGRKTIYVASHASHIVGWPVDEGRALLKELIEFATQPRFVYRHRWQDADIVMWDNLATMHRGTPFKDTVHIRDMRRTVSYETSPGTVATGPMH
jgi:alpha-ketoglutarate-dependent 2,4-dichlorophenoxyacetate dioxygenase